MLDMAFGLTDTSRLGCQVKVTKELDGMTVTLPAATRNMFVDGESSPGNLSNKGSPVPRPQTITLERCRPLDVITIYYYLMPKVTLVRTYACFLPIDLFAQFFETAAGTFRSKQALGPKVLFLSVSPRVPLWPTLEANPRPRFRLSSHAFLVS
jgi:hypothetical protein